MQESPIEMQTLAHWKQIGRNTTASPPLLTPSNILLVKKNFGTSLKKNYLNISPFYKVHLKLPKLKMRKSGECVCS